MKRLLSYMTVCILGCGPTHAQEFCAEINALVADGHKAFVGVASGRVSVNGAATCEASVPPESYALGELRCEWKYSKFTEVKVLEQSLTTMVKGMYECLKPSFEASEMPDTYRFRGKSRATKQLVDVLASTDTINKGITLYVNILKPDM